METHQRLLLLQCAAQADTLDILMPELEELRREVDRLQGVEAQYANTKRDLDAAKASLAESHGIQIR